MAFNFGASNTGQSSGFSFGSQQQQAPGKLFYLKKKLTFDGSFHFNLNIFFLMKHLVLLQLQVHHLVCLAKPGPQASVLDKLKHHNQPQPVFLGQNQLFHLVNLQPLQHLVLLRQLLPQFLGSQHRALPASVSEEEQQEVLACLASQQAKQPCQVLPLPQLLRGALD